MEIEQSDMEKKTPREALSKFYSDNRLDQDGGNSSSSVKIELTSKLHFYIPNFDARRKAVPKHDIHHLLTGYDTSFAGECEISAWEIASGCKKYWAAFVIDTSGIMLGIPLNFMGVIRAYARGRRTSNLYHDKFSTEEAMDMKISVLRESLSLDKFPKETRVTIIDFILFSGFVLYGILFSICSLVLLPLVLIYSLYAILRTKNKQ
ncbi:MAG: hypothetical protein ACJ76F_06080 [Bacteroidia bacterium]